MSSPSRFRAIDFPVVRRGRETGAVKRFQTLGVGHRNAEAARDIPGDVNSPYCDRVDMEKPPAGEHADRRGAAAEVDDGRPELGFVVDHRREARGVRRRDHGLYAQMAPLDDQHQVARRRRLARRDMQVDAEFLADHPLRIVDIARRV